MLCRTLVLPTAPVAHKCQKFATNTTKLNSRCIDSALVQFSDQKSIKNSSNSKFYLIFGCFGVWRCIWNQDMMGKIEPNRPQNRRAIAQTTRFFIAFTTNMRMLGQLPRRFKDFRREMIAAPPRGVPLVKHKNDGWNGALGPISL
jgi:hypothetical protein